MSITCLLIGQDNLLIQCGDYLMRRNHSIKWVISSEPSIKSWCKKYHITCVASFDQIQESTECMVDYIFSIVNGEILRAADLKIARFDAINYHDSLLPEYAGVNATTWAIANDEKLHGITWHKINKGIDEGEIVYQQSFPIYSDDTALALNLRCFERAIVSFSTLVKKIEHDTLESRKQEKEQRSYYGIDYVLPNLGFIDWEKAEGAVIEALSRALTFGDYNNNVGTLKLFIDNSYYIITSIMLSAEQKNDCESGKILAIMTDGFLVSTNNRPILIKELMTPRGEPVNLSKFIDKYGLAVGYQFPAVRRILCSDNKLAYGKALKNENYWLNILSDFKEHSIFSDRIVIEHGEYVELPPVSAATYQANQDNIPYILLSSILIYLYRINNYERMTLFLSYKDIINEGANSSALFSEDLPINCSFQDNTLCCEFVKFVIAELDTLSEKGSYLTDIYARHPSIKTIKKVARITLEFSDGEVHFPKNSIIHFSIDRISHKINIYHRIDPQYQGGALEPVLKNMPDHLSNIINVMISDPSCSIHNFSFLTKEEHNTISQLSVGRHISLPSNTISDLFERQVMKTPDKAAVFHNDKIITYQQLWRQTEQVAAFINMLDSTSQIPFAVPIKSNINWIAVCLGVLKANAICVPLNNIFSTENTVDLKVYDAEEMLGFQVASYELLKVNYATQVDSKACLINGKFLTHRDIINYCYWFLNQTRLMTSSVLDLTLVKMDDLFFPAVFSPLFIGGALVISNYDDCNLENYLFRLQQYRVSHIRLSTMYWAKLLQYPGQISQLKDLQYLVLPSQPNNDDISDKWLALCPDSQFIIHTGIQEMQ